MGGAIAVEDVVNLGCGVSKGIEDIQAVATAGTIDVAHLAFAEGCCPLGVVPTVGVSGGELSLSYQVVDDFCCCVCPLDVSYRIVNVPAGKWSLVSALSGLATSVTVP